MTVIRPAAQAFAVGAVAGLLILAGFVAGLAAAERLRTTPQED